jgi:hypothetical protein
MLIARKRAPGPPSTEPPLSIITLLQGIPEYATAQVKHLDKLYQGTFKLKLKDESKIALTDTVQLFDASEFGTEKPVSPLLCFLIGEIQDGKSI